MPYVISAGGGKGTKLTISDTAPNGARVGELWWDSEQGVLRVYYDDGDTAQWVDASAQGPQGPTGATGPTGAAGIGAVVLATATPAAYGSGVPFHSLLLQYGQSDGGGNMGANTIGAAPFRLGRDATISKLGVHVSTAAASSNARVAIYASDSASLGPTTLLYDTGNLSTAATGVVYSTGAGLALTGGTLYWAAVNISDASVQLRTIINSAMWNNPLGYDSSSFSNATGHLEKAFTYAAFPSSFPTGSTRSNSSMYNVFASTG